MHFLSEQQIGIGYTVFLICYGLLGLVLNFLLLRKLGYKNAYLAFIPIAWLIPFIDISKHSRWCILLVFVPFVNTIYELWIMLEPMKRLNGSFILYIIYSFLVIPLPIYIIYLLVTRPKVSQVIE